MAKEEQVETAEVVEESVDKNALLAEISADLKEKGYEFTVIPQVRLGLIENRPLDEAETKELEKTGLEVNEKLKAANAALMPVRKVVDVVSIK